MKKVFLAVLAILGFAFTTSAQQGTPKKAQKTEKTVVVKTTETKTVLKKDGTPDKRYKQNEKTKVVLKKDGTPDKRYNNKK
jgi:Flp pilus assembly protein TadB